MVGRRKCNGAKIYTEAWDVCILLNYQQRREPTRRVANVLKDKAYTEERDGLVICTRGRGALCCSVKGYREESWTKHK